jgi:hypothetical protein
MNCKDALRWDVVTPQPGKCCSGLVPGFHEVKDIGRSMDGPSALHEGTEGGEGGLYPEVVAVRLEVTLSGTAERVKLALAVGAFPQGPMPIMKLGM